MSKYILDVEKLSSITGKTQKEIADTLGVSEASLSEAKSTPTKKWGIIDNYIKNYNDVLPLENFIVELKSDQNGNA